MDDDHHHVLHLWQVWIPLHTFEDGKDNDNDLDDDIDDDDDDILHLRQVWIPLHPFALRGANVFQPSPQRHLHNNAVNDDIDDDDESGDNDYGDNDNADDFQWIF